MPPEGNNNDKTIDEATINEIKSLIKSYIRRTEDTIFLSMEDETVNDKDILMRKTEALMEDCKTRILNALDNNLEGKGTFLNSDEGEPESVKDKINKITQGSVDEEKTDFHSDLKADRQTLRKVLEKSDSNDFVTQEPKGMLSTLVQLDDDIEVEVLEIENGEIIKNKTTVGEYAKNLAKELDIEYNEETTCEHKVLDEKVSKKESAVVLNKRCRNCSEVVTQQEYYEKERLDDIIDKLKREAKAAADINVLSIPDVYEGLRRKVFNWLHNNK